MKRIITVTLLLLIAMGASADSFETLVNVMESGNFYRFKQLMSSEIQVDDRNEYGSTPLLWVSGFAEPKYIEHMISLGADINAIIEDPTDEDLQNGMNALAVAAWGGNTDLVEFYIENGIDMNFVNDAMEFAAMEGHVEAGEFLLPYVDDINRNGESMSYMAWAVNHDNYGAEAFVRMLIENGADPNADSDYEYGVTHFLAGDAIPSLSKYFMTLDIDWEKETHWGATPLNIAVNSSLPFTRALIEKGVNLNNITSFSGFTPLLQAVYDGALYTVQLLIDAGADTEITSGYSYAYDNTSGLTALKLAEQLGYNTIADIIREETRIEVPLYSFEDEIQYGFPFAMIRSDISRKLNAFDGSQESIEDFSGQVVVHNIWATWCGYCVAEMGSLQELSDRYEDEGLIVIAESVDDNQRAAENFMRENNLSFPGYFFISSDEYPDTPAYSFPTTYIYDSQGMLISTVIGARDWVSDDMISLFDRLVEEANGGSVSTPITTEESFPGNLGDAPVPAPPGTLFVPNPNSRSIGKPSE